MGTRFGVALAFGIFALTPAPDAFAFCRTTTVAIPADFQPRPDACWDQGHPLFWKNACVGYSIQKDASRQVSYDDASQAMAKAFTKWTSATCATDGTGSSRVSVDVRDLGPVNCNLLQYNQDQPNQHVIVFRDDNWPHNDINNTLALTTVIYNPDTGEIYDADMEINTFQQHVTLQDPIPPDGYDFASIVTHEAGHFLGMAHSGDPHATMFAHYKPGSTAMRELTSDDVQGICTVYRPDGRRTLSGDTTVLGEACDPTPRHGFSTECATSSANPGCTGNRISPRRAESGAPWGIVAAVLGFSILRRRRRCPVVSS